MSKIAPCLWFDGKAEEAARFYVSLMPDSRIDAVLPYRVETPGGAPGDVMAVEFTLAGESYMALNGGPAFAFTPAISLFVSCADQAEVDRLWAALSDGGSPSQCGWLKDRWGLSWQVVPEQMPKLLAADNPVRAKAVMDAFMRMKKFDIRKIEEAAKEAA